MPVAALAAPVSRGQLSLACSRAVTSGSRRGPEEDEERSGRVVAAESTAVMSAWRGECGEEGEEEGRTAVEAVELALTAASNSTSLAD